MTIKLAAFGAKAPDLPLCRNEHLEAHARNYFYSETIDRQSLQELFWELDLPAVKHT